MNTLSCAWTKVQKVGKAVPWFIPGTEDMRVGANEATCRDQLRVGLRLSLYLHSRVEKSTETRMSRSSGVTGRGFRPPLPQT